MPTQAYIVDLVQPPGFQPTTATVLFAYNSTKLSIPGTGTATTVRQRVVAPAPIPQAFTPNDKDYAVQVLVSRNVPLGQLFTATFDRCSGAAAPTLADVSCTVLSCAQGGGGVEGCTCSAATPLTERRAGPRRSGPRLRRAQRALGQSARCASCAGNTRRTVVPRSSSLSMRIAAAVGLDDVLDDRQAEAGAAELARARLVDAVEALGQARQVLGRHADAGVARPRSRRSSARSSTAQPSRHLAAVSGRAR